MNHNIKKFAEELANISFTSEEDFEGKTIEIAGTTYELTKDMVEIRISAKEGFNVASENNIFVILNTALDEDLINEGIAREIVSKVQQMRKNKDFNIVDRIKLMFNGDEEVERAINSYKDYIMNETLSTTIEKQDNLTENYDINGHDVYLDIEK